MSSSSPSPNRSPLGLQGQTNVELLQAYRSPDPFMGSRRIPDDLANVIGEMTDVLLTSKQIFDAQDFQILSKYHKAGILQKDRWFTGDMLRFGIMKTPPDLRMYWWLVERGFHVDSWDISLIIETPEEGYDWYLPTRYTIPALDILYRIPPPMEETVERLQSRMYSACKRGKLDVFLWLFRTAESTLRKRLTEDQWRTFQDSCIRWANTFNHEHMSIYLSDALGFQYIYREEEDDEE